MTPSSTTNCADRAGVHAQQRVPQVFPDCQHSAQIVSRHERERSRFSVTCDPLVCEDLHNAGVHIRDRREGDLHLLSLTEVIPVDYGTRKGQKMDDLFFLGYQYMGAIYESILR